MQRPTGTPGRGARARPASPTDAMALLETGKNAAKRLLKAAVSWLPAGASAAVLDQVSENLGGWPALSRLAPRCAVDSVIVQGDYGLIEGSPRDLTVLGGYATAASWARRTNDLLRGFFPESGGLYLDVGANIGLTTIPVARNPRVTCLALEPNPAVHRFLAANVRRNCPHGNVTTRQVAVFSRRDVLELEVAPDNQGDNRLRLSDRAGRHGEERWGSVKVEALPLDELLPEVPGPAAIKIDVQGAEPFVFEGGARALDRAGLLVLEWSPYLIARLGGRPEAVTGYLARAFREATIAFGEEGPLPRPEPIAVVVERLLAMAHQARGDSSVYADVIARR
jgi:FkbM family methyltransferase